MADAPEQSRNMTFEQMNAQLEALLANSTQRLNQSVENQAIIQELMNRQALDNEIAKRRSLERDVARLRRALNLLTEVVQELEAKVASWSSDSD